MSQLESVSYPRVHQRPDGRVEVVISYQGKRMRLQSGTTFGIHLKPNSFPEQERKNQANLLAAQVYAKLLSGFNPFNKAVKNKIHGLSDVEVLKRVLNKKVAEGFSKHYNTQLRYSFESLVKNTIGGTVNSRAVEKTLNHFSNPTSYNTMRRGLVVLFNAANEIGWEKKPMKGIRNKRAKATLNKPIDNVAELLEEIKNYNANLYLCCLLTYGCLLRPHREVRELTWGDFSKDLSTIRLSGSRNKSGRNRVVPVPSYVREILRPSIPEHNLFTGDLRAPNPDYFKSAWGRFKKRSKLLKEGQTLYSFRHTGAIDIYKRTGSLEKLKAAMGHSNIMVSLTYLRGLDIAELKEGDMHQLW